MRGKYIFVVLALALCFSAPAIVKAFFEDNGKPMHCGGAETQFCSLYKICKPVLEQYPESEINEEGKDCTLTVGNSQLIIRRKRTDGAVGYFYYYKVLPDPKRKEHADAGTFAGLVK